MICDVRKQSAGIEIKPRLPANGTGSKAQERGTQPGRSPCGINSSPTRTNSEEDASRGVPSGMLAVGTGATGEKSGPYAGVQHPEDPAGSRGREELPERQGQPECQNRRPSRPTPSMGRSVGQAPYFPLLATDEDSEKQRHGTLVSCGSGAGGNSVVVVGRSDPKVADECPPNSSTANVGTGSPYVTNIPNYPSVPASTVANHGTSAISGFLTKSTTKRDRGAGQLPPAHTVSSSMPSFLTGGSRGAATETTDKSRMAVTSKVAPGSAISVSTSGTVGGIPRDCGSPCVPSTPVESAPALGDTGADGEGNLRTPRSQASPSETGGSCGCDGYEVVSWCHSRDDGERTTGTNAEAQQTRQLKWPSIAGASASSDAPRETRDNFPVDLVAPGEQRPDGRSLTLKTDRGSSSSTASDAGDTSCERNANTKDGRSEVGVGPSCRSKEAKYPEKKKALEKREPDGLSAAAPQSAMVSSGPSGAESPKLPGDTRSSASIGHDNAVPDSKSSSKKVLMEICERGGISSPRGLEDTASIIYGSRVAARCRGAKGAGGLELENREGQGVEFHSPEGGVEVRELEGGVLVVRRSAEEKKRSPERLNLHRRQLKSCPIIQGDSRLRLLNYQNNLISKINNLANLPCLIFLDLYNNLIDTLEGPLSAMSSLRVVMAGKNRIQKITNIESLCKLDVLDLHSNVIQDMEGLRTLQELRVLNLAGNRIRVVEGVSSLKALTELNLRRNYIERVTELDALPRLQRLFLSHNRINNFTDCECVLSIGSLLELSLDGNPVVRQDVSGSCYRQFVLQHLRSLHHLDLRRVSNDEHEPHPMRSQIHDEALQSPQQDRDSSANRVNGHPTATVVPTNGCRERNGQPPRQARVRRGGVTSPNPAPLETGEQKHGQQLSSQAADSETGSGSGSVLQAEEGTAHVLNHGHKIVQGKAAADDRCLRLSRDRSSSGSKEAEGSGSDRVTGARPGKHGEGTPASTIPSNRPGRIAPSPRQKEPEEQQVAREGDAGGEGLRGDGGASGRSGGSRAGAATEESEKVRHHGKERRMPKDRQDAIAAARMCWETRTGRAGRGSRAPRSGNSKGEQNEGSDNACLAGHPFSSSTPPSSARDHGSYSSRSSAAAPRPGTAPGGSSSSSALHRSAGQAAGRRSRDSKRGAKAASLGGVGYFELEERATTQEFAGSLSDCASEPGVDIGKPAITLKVYGDVWKWLRDERVHSLKNRVVEAQLSFVHVDSLSKKAGIMAKTFPNLTSLQLLDNDLRTLQQLERLDPITSNLKGLYLGKNPLLQNASKAALAAWLKSHGNPGVRLAHDDSRFALRPRPQLAKVVPRGKAEAVGSSPLAAPFSDPAAAFLPSSSGEPFAEGCLSWQTTAAAQAGLTMVTGEISKRGVGGSTDQLETQAAQKEGEACSAAGCTRIEGTNSAGAEAKVGVIEQGSPRGSSGIGIGSHPPAPPLTKALGIRKLREPPLCSPGPGGDGRDGVSEHEMAREKAAGEAFARLAEARDSALRSSWGAAALSKSSMGWAQRHSPRTEGTMTVEGPSEEGDDDSSHKATVYAWTRADEVARLVCSTMVRRACEANGREEGFQDAWEAVLNRMVKVRGRPHESNTLEEY